MTGTGDLLQRVLDYAKQVARSEADADEGSMATATALAKLYEAREWVPEWLEQHPIKTAKAYVGGRPPQPDSRHRFSQWLAWKCEQAHNPTLQSAHTYRLLYAHEIGGYLSGGEITSEWAIRPFGWLRRNGYLDRAEEVWKDAVDLAGGDPQDVTRKHTSAALAHWKRDTFGGSAAISKVVAASRAQTKRQRAQAAVQELFETAAKAGEKAEWEAFDKWYWSFRLPPEQSDV